MLPPMAGWKSANLLDAANRIAVGWMDAVRSNSVVRLLASLAVLCFLFGLSLQGQPSAITGDVSPEQASFGRLLFYVGFPFAGLAVVAAWLVRGREAHDLTSSDSSRAAAVEALPAARTGATREPTPSSTVVRVAWFGAVLFIPLGLLILLSRDALAVPALFLGGVCVAVAIRAARRAP